MLYDKDIREPLFDFLEELYGKIRILEEKQIGRSRADAVMITPWALYGIEIKSDADTYVRLARQVLDYNKFYDYNYVVAGTSHALNIKEHVPEWWGIIIVEQEKEKVDFYLMREPSKNPKMEMKKKLSLLWRPELVHIQELNQMPKYKNKSKLFVIEKILCKVSEEMLQLQISEELFQRDYNEIEKIIQEYRKENHLPVKRKRKRYKSSRKVLSNK